MIYQYQKIKKTNPKKRKIPPSPEYHQNKKSNKKYIEVLIENLKCK
jgi:hypothetical protein